MKRKILFIWFLTLLLLPQPILAKGYPIQWNPERIEQTIGNGIGATEDLLIIFTSKTNLENVDLWVVPELQPFMRVNPNHFASIQANTPYEVKVHLSIPPNTQDGIYDGTVHLRVGSRTYPKPLKVEINIDYEDISIPATTKVLSESTAFYLTSVSVDGSILTFSQSTPELEALIIGDIIAIGINNVTPNGLLREVTGISISGTGVVVETIQATLANALYDGAINFSRDLTPSDISSAVALRRGVNLHAISEGQSFEGFYLEINDVVLYDFDGDYTTTNDQIEADGSISFKPSLQLILGIENFQLKHLTFTNTITKEAELEISAKVTILDVDKKFEITRYYLTPFTVWVGWVPVIITPVLSVNVGVDGEVSVGITTKVTQEATLTAGLRYDEGTWSPISDFSSSFSFVEPSLSLECKFKGYAGPQLSLLVYGVVGPYADINGYLELDADLFRTPWWKLFGGLEAGVGVRFEVLSRVIADYYLPAVIGYRVLLAQAETPPPISGFIKGIVRDAVTLSPLPDVSVKVYSLNFLIASGQTDSEGSYSISLVPGAGYKVEFKKTGYIPVTHYNVSVDPNEITYLETILQIDEAYSGVGNVSGTIRNALSGAGVGNITVDLRSGINSTIGIVVASDTTSSDGSYSISNLDAGNYTGQCSGEGYNTTYFTVICIGGMTTPNQNAAITPILGEDEIRIILTWGETPWDLDSHLTGPLLEGTRFHLYYPYAETNAGSPWPEFVKLDLDDVTSYGPETTTIYQQIDGVYRYSVHNYTNRYSTSSTALSNSNAQVRVYRGSILITYFNVPSNQEGTLWTVFELSGETITSINAMSYESNPASIQSISLGKLIKTDAVLLRNLPEKR